MKMRCVSVVDRVELDASVSVMPAAICVDDVDNDDANELCVGTIDGSVYIYKGIASNKPWKANLKIKMRIKKCLLYQDSY